MCSYLPFSILVINSPNPMDFKLTSLIPNLTHHHYTALPSPSYVKTTRSYISPSLPARASVYPALLTVKHKHPLFQPCRLGTQKAALAQTTDILRLQHSSDRYSSVTLCFSWTSDSDFSCLLSNKPPAIKALMLFFLLLSLSHLSSPKIYDSYTDHFSDLVQYPYLCHLSPIEKIFHDKEI